MNFRSRNWLIVPIKERDRRVFLRVPGQLGFLPTPIPLRHLQMVSARQKGTKASSRDAGLDHATAYPPSERTLGSLQYLYLKCPHRVTHSLERCATAHISTTRGVGHGLAAPNDRVQNDVITSNILALAPCAGGA